MGESYDLGAGRDSGTPDGVREAWQPGDLAWYEYHCLESDDSADAALWHHSHQQVTVLGRGADEDLGGTFLERAEAGCPNVYLIRFADGYEGTAFEDELLTGPEHYERPAPPPGLADFRAAGYVTDEWDRWQRGSRAYDSAGCHLLPYLGVFGQADWCELDGANPGIWGEPGDGSGPEGFEQDLADAMAHALRNGILDRPPASRPALDFPVANPPAAPARAASASRRWPAARSGTSRKARS